MDSNETKELCKRCKATEAQLPVRAEPLCQPCFSAYVSSKVIKRLETFRPKHFASQAEAPVFLVPLSFGVSSVSLSYLLIDQLERQLERSGRFGFRLHFLHVLDYNVGPPLVAEDMLQKLKQIFPGHKYSTTFISLPFSHDQATDSAFGNGSGHASLPALLDKIPTSTSKADVMSLLFIRAVVNFSKANGYEFVLWGDSTTRLAEKVLSETAKGRGFSVPWQVNDGPTPYGVSFYYPVRDVLKKELVSFATLTPSYPRHLLPLGAFEPQRAPVSSRNTTIDMLMRQYFESVEDSYPSIVSNVARTSGKLEPGVVGIRRCRLCILPVTEELLGVGGWKGNQDSESAATEAEAGLCHGCSRSIPTSAVHLLPT